jgi:hypothetical protein
MTPLIPALLTTTSSRPNAATVAATAAFTCSELVTSATVQVAASPSAAAPASSSPAARPARQTLAPSAANARAVAMPMLPSPPVISAALPRSSPLGSMPLMLMPPPPARLARQRTPLDGAGIKGHSAERTVVSLAGMADVPGPGPQGAWLAR